MSDFYLLPPYRYTVPGEAVGRGQDPVWAHNGSVAFFLSAQIGCKDFKSDVPWPGVLAIYFGIIAVKLFLCHPTLGRRLDF